MRHRWVHRPGHPKANDMGMVNVLDLGDDAGPSSEASSGAAIIADRWREGSKATDGTDISSRAKEREYMARNGLAHAADFPKYWEKAEARRRDYMQRGDVGRDLHETVGRAAYEVSRRKR